MRKVSDIEVALVSAAQSVGFLSIEEIQRILSSITATQEPAGYIEKSDLANLKAGNSVIVYVSDRESLGVPIFLHPALPEREGWEPIASAPKGDWSTPLLVCQIGEAPDWYGNNLCAGYSAVPCTAYWNDAGDCWTFVERPHDICEPTHWRNLAASPSHQEQRTNPIALDELSRRGMDERMQEVVTLLVGETVPASATGKVTEGELWALRFGPPCACGESGLSPDDDDESGYCNDCRAAEGRAHD